MDSARREELAKRVLGLSGADQTEVAVFSDRNELTRFTHNAVHQNVAGDDVSVRVRAIVGKKTGVASTNVLDEHQLGDLVHRAVEIAKLAPADPELVPLPGGGSYQTPQGAYFEGTAAATPSLRAQMCEAIFKTSEEQGYWCAGFTNTSGNGMTVVNSNGVCASFDGSDAIINVKMNGADSTGYAEGFEKDVSRLDASAIGRTAAQKTHDSAQPRSVDPGEWTVILEPAAFGELFAYLSDHFSAQAFDEGSSFLSDGLNTKYLGDNVTVMDDYANPLCPGMPFDYEGQPTQRLTLIENGIAKNIVTDSYWAHKLGRPNTGHALPGPNAFGPQPMHLVVSPGSKSIADLISQTQRGLLITRFWYVRTVDQKKAIVTGMTRDGTFLIENGLITGGVRNMRFNQSIIEALANCEFSSEQRWTGNYSYSVVSPAAKIQGFRFTSGTSF